MGNLRKSGDCQFAFQPKRVKLACKRRGQESSPFGEYLAYLPKRRYAVMIAYGELEVMIGCAKL